MLARILLVLFLLSAAAAHAGQGAPSECPADLEALSAYMVANDSGAHDLLKKAGRARLEAALSSARAKVAATQDDASCLAALREYLKTFRERHLSLRPAAPPPAGAQTHAKPSFRTLSDRTAVLVVPSFGDQDGSAIANFVETHADDIARRPNLIIDVRGNAGGSDWTYVPLLKVIDANVRRDIGAWMLATPANSAANRIACDVLAPASKTCRDATNAAAEAMDKAPAGTFIPMPGQADVEILSPDKVWSRPSRIGILVDHGCGSSCEEFLLAARQSFKVKLFGQPSMGSLDYSNLRPWTLPSRKRLLLYATSKSLRLPIFSVDLAGIPPDQLLLPSPTGPSSSEREVLDVQRVLESVQR